MEKVEGFSEEAAKIWSVLERHVGEGNAITGAELAEATGIERTALSAIIRKTDFPGRVVGKRGRGYFVAFSDDKVSKPGPRKHATGTRARASRPAPGGDDGFFVTVRGPGIDLTRPVDEDAAVRAILIALGKEAA